MKHNIENMMVGFVLFLIGIWMLINACMATSISTVTICGICVYLAISIYITVLYGKHVVADTRTERYGQLYWAIVTGVTESSFCSDRHLKSSERCGVVHIKAYLDGKTKEFKEESYIGFSRTLEAYPVGSYLKVKIYENDFNFTKDTENTPPEEVQNFLRQH